MDIYNLDDLQAAEKLIGRMLQRIRLDAVLLGLRRVGDLPSIGRYPPIRLEPFMIAGAAMFALRYCPPRPSRKTYRPLPDSELVPFVRLVNDYLLADPLSLDETMQDGYYEANPAFTFLRMVASQFPYNVGYFGQYARSLILYEELPPKLAAATQPSGGDIGNVALGRRRPRHRGPCPAYGDVSRIQRLHRRPRLR